MIHGDCNEQNILVKEIEGSTGNYGVAGVLDWGDSHYSYYLFEASIAALYAMIDSNVVGQIEAGSFNVLILYRFLLKTNALKLLGDS
jgi:hydroxylysine kinase